jgi:hypothetical protein
MQRRKKSRITRNFFSTFEGHVDYILDKLRIPIAAEPTPETPTTTAQVTMSTTISTTTTTTTATTSSTTLAAPNRTQCVRCGLSLPSTEFTPTQLKKPSSQCKGCLEKYVWNK